MHYRSPGGTGVQVSPLTFGSMLLHEMPEKDAPRLFDPCGAIVQRIALHLENLHRVLTANGFNVNDIASADLHELNRAWHRLDPWPDSIAGLADLRTRYLIGPLSNANLAMLADMAKRAGLPWDVIIGADVTRAYKPRPEAYTRAADILNLRSGEVMLVAAHNSDLAAARDAGLATAFIPRPTEYGAGQTRDLVATQAWDVVASDLIELAVLCKSP